MEIKKEISDIWKGVYRGVSFEIKNWTRNDNQDKKERWAYYLIINLERIPQKYSPNSFWLDGKKVYGRISYNYFNHNILNDLDWHGGITWYSKINGFDGDEKIIKVGCDYQHYWDEGKTYNLNYIKNDVKETIDKFLKHIPDYKYRCVGNGKLYNQNEGYITKGRFHSKEYFGETNWFKELDIKNE